MEAAPPVVYIIDDDASVRRALTRLMRSVGLDAVAFASAEAFLQVGPPQRQCCLVLDVRLPGMTGLDLLDHLTATGVSLPVIVITAHDDTQVRARASSAVIAYLRKPFDDEALLAAIQRASGHDSGSPS